ncbi:uncharacterized protein LOC135464124 [Liolophura sinensis]|uniref:uncharacterized protein LOC135464124 n=1 Tax=Liolophura sinensis TaxID=3198878 RepID=UPI003159371E
MGVSLERVQFKFASIIGELCSDPDVLSQFAVWLDLRLAEYKLKGAISLECSGEEPDPIWLKGLNKGRRTISSAEKVTHPRFERRERRRLSGDSSSRSTHGAYDPAPNPLSRDLLDFQPQDVSLDHHQSNSPDIVVVKEESTGVFPVSLHTHVNTNSNVPGGSSHKRSPAFDPYSSNTDHWSRDSYGQSSKRRRTAESVDSPSNQSLMSVLGVTDTSETVTSAMGDTPVVPSTSSDGVTSPVAGTSTINPQVEVSADFTDTSQNDSQCFQDMSWINNSAMSADNNDSGASPNDSSAGLKYTCDICGQMFTMKHNLKRHQKMHDPGRAQQTCNLCGATFSRADNYASHMKKKHAD